MRIKIFECFVRHYHVRVGVDAGELLLYRVPAQHARHAQACEPTQLLETATGNYNLKNTNIFLVVDENIFISE